MKKQILKKVISIFTNYQLKKKIWVPSMQY